MKTLDKKSLAADEFRLAVDRSEMIRHRPHDLQILPLGNAAEPAGTLAHLPDSNARKFR